LYLPAQALAPVMPEYTENMPKLPELDIGLVPIAQMLVLPPLIFPITYYNTRA
jgi:hypothetical protein